VTVLTSAGAGAGTGGAGGVAGTSTLAARRVCVFTKSELSSAWRSAAMSCGRWVSLGVIAQSMARSSGAPKTTALAVSAALGMLSSRTREADSMGFCPVVIQYITAPSE